MQAEVERIEWDIWSIQVGGRGVRGRGLGYRAKWGGSVVGGWDLSGWAGAWAGGRRLVAGYGWVSSWRGGWVQRAPFSGRPAKGTGERVELPCFKYQEHQGQFFSGSCVAGAAICCVAPAACRTQLAHLPSKLTSPLLFCLLSAACLHQCSTLAALCSARRRRGRRCRSCPTTTSCSTATWAHPTSSAPR